MLNAALVADVRSGAAAVSVYPVPALLTCRLPNVATPRADAAVRVPERAPPPGLAPSATITLLVYVVSAFPLAFCATTTTAGLITRLAVVLLGWTVNTRCVAPLPEPARPMRWLRAVSHPAASTVAAIIAHAARMNPPALAACEPRVPHYPACASWSARPATTTPSGRDRSIRPSCPPPKC